MGRRACPAEGSKSKQTGTEGGSTPGTCFRELTEARASISTTMKWIVSCCSHVDISWQPFAQNSSAFFEVLSTSLLKGQKAKARSRRERKKEQNTTRKRKKKREEAEGRNKKVGRG